MAPEMRIPSHITALYVFAVVNLMALFHVSLVDANIIVMDKWNITIQELPDLQAKFGPSIPSSGVWMNNNETEIRTVLDAPAEFGPDLRKARVWGHVYHAGENDGCVSLPPPPPPTTSTPGGNTSDGWIVLIHRYGCDFDVKVLVAQNASYVAAIIFNTESDDLVSMGSGKYGYKVKIPSAFIGRDNAEYLKVTCNLKRDFSIIIDDMATYDLNLYLLPFCIVVGVCFVLMLVFMLAKWIRDVRKRRRSRLSKEHLKRIPVKKFRKGDPYDMCAICLDEYEEGDKLRILPCAHAYHMKCIDPWLTKNKRNCPVCKRKIALGDGDRASSDSESDEDDGSGERDPAGENTPLLGASGGGAGPAPGTSRGGNTFTDSGLPETVREQLQRIESSNSDSGSDGEAGARAPRRGYSLLHESPVEIHAPTLSRSPRNGGRSYGATATLEVSNELPRGGSINSAYAVGEGEEASVARGAVVHGDVREEDRPIVLEDEDPIGPGSDVRFVDEHYGEELRGVLSDGASVAEEAAAQAPQEPEAGTSQGDGGAANGRKKKGKKEEKLPKKAVKKKKRRRDEVA